MVVLVTGAAGQLGQALESIAINYPEIHFVFATSTFANITDKEQLHTVFNEFKPDYCINAAAYTAVDKAESEPEKAFAINVTGAKNLAEICKNFNTTLIHVSTDFVFDGNQSKPYTELDVPNPIGVYGKTKLEGEKIIQQTLVKHFIIRTSWVYSQFGNNFMKTMIRLGNERDQLNVVNDQIGTPTHAVDLAEVLVTIIRKKLENAYGVYHFSNEGQCSWYDFAAKIFELHNIDISLKPIPTVQYPTPAKRPYYSVLDKSKIKKKFNITIDNWTSSLVNHI